MKVDVTSMFFNSKIEGSSATAAWGTSVGKQTPPCVLYEGPDTDSIFTGMLYCSKSDTENLQVSGMSNTREVVLFSVFDKVVVNGKEIPGASFIMLLVREHSATHEGRMILSYPMYAKYKKQSGEIVSNEETKNRIAKELGCSDMGCWFVSEISIANQDTLVINAHVVDPVNPKVYTGKSKDRTALWQQIADASGHPSNEMVLKNLGDTRQVPINDNEIDTEEIANAFKEYLCTPGRFRSKDTGPQYWKVIVSGRPEIQFIFEIIKEELDIETDTLFTIIAPDDIDRVYKRVKADPRNNDFQSQICSAILKKYLDFIKEYENREETPEEVEEKSLSGLPLQLIYFGAPGTSKSTTIKKETELKGKEVHRITFHPDTDYSSFVGCYKPTQDGGSKILNKEEVIAKLREFKNDGNAYPCQRFSAAYWESVKALSSQDIKDVLDACGFTESMKTEVPKGVSVGEMYGRRGTGKITYKFVPQTFTKAYVSAWSKSEDVFLVIEEINRGNCAQIFGDLFQLLDRNGKGYSDYAIEPDSDLQRYLAEEAFAGVEGLPEDIKSGKSMLLPPNLHIWATMNTSDQSLFPIDSAFKRRWDWRYLPIKDEGKGHVIRIGDQTYDWWKFLAAVNERIEALTESEDKQLGYWFARPKSGVEIDLDTFVSKVVFYLWNDVFKDYGNDGNSPFMIKVVEDGVEKKVKLSFHKFFDAQGKVDASVAEKFLKNMGIEPEKVVATVVTEDEEPEDEPKAPAAVAPAQPVPAEDLVEEDEPDDDDDDEDDDDETSIDLSSLLKS